MSKYTVGIDYGTLSARAVLVNTENGAEAASAVYEYPHAVMDKALPDGSPLPADWALQHPADYINALSAVIPAVLKSAGVDARDVIGAAVDFTACTVLPVNAEGTPLCLTAEFEHEKHAYVKLWKHHAAQPEANQINALALERGERWLDSYGGKISSEWFFPKLLQVLHEAPQVYAAADSFMEAGDWIVRVLTGKHTRNSCAAGYKAMYSAEGKYPDKAFFAALDPAFENVVSEKCNAPVLPLGSIAGYITPKAAKLCALAVGTPVCVANVDAHVCAPAAKITGEGAMLAIMGTSACHMLVGNKLRPVKGICGVVKDGILPGFYGYEAGQSCVGDHFSWFIDNCLPKSYFEQAESRGMNIHALLREKADKLTAGESGLLALDWWGGNRSVLVDTDLSGLLLGMTLATTPEMIYRALIEATAYGTRMIIETFRAAGIEVKEFFAAGGIANKDPMTMQIYADVLKLPIRIAGSGQGPALGCAIFAAAAAGKAAGGYDSLAEAAMAIGSVKDKIYIPQADSGAIYDRLYAEYKTLHDCFGRGENDVMKRLKAIKAEVRK